MKAEALVDHDGNVLEIRTEGPPFKGLDLTLGRVVKLNIKESVVSGLRFGEYKVSKAGKAEKSKSWKPAKVEL